MQKGIWNKERPAMALIIILVIMWTVWISVTSEATRPDRETVTNCGGE